MSPGKHQANRLSSYLEIHQTHMDQLLRGPFVVSEDLALEEYDGFLTISGTIRCVGGCYISVDKQLNIVAGDGANALVRTVRYRYHAGVDGLGNILRYDSPHAHRPFDHVHRYDLLGGGAIVVGEIHNEDQIPTLREVVDEVADWFWAHSEEVLRRRLAEDG